MLSVNITYFYCLLFQSISKHFANIKPETEQRFYFFPPSPLGATEDSICLIEHELLMPKQLTSSSEGYHIQLKLQERFRDDVVLNLFLTLSLWMSSFLGEELFFKGIRLTEG